MPAKPKARIGDPNTEQWHSSMAKRSQLTADVNYRRLRAFVNQMAVKPSHLVRLAEKAKQTELRDLLDRFVAEEVKKGRSGWYIHSTIVAVKGWLAWNDAPLRLKVSIDTTSESPRRANEVIPTNEDLHSAILAATTHERDVIALMAFSGLRPGAIGNYTGTEGLRMKDLRDAHYVGDGCRKPDPAHHVEGKVTFDPLPAAIRVRSSGSKTRRAYTTFIGAEGASYLAASLEMRLARGEKLTPESGVVSAVDGSKEFVTSINLGGRVRRAFKATGMTDRGGMTLRPYTLRRYFLNRCLAGAAKVGAPDRFIEHWAGHLGDVTAKHYSDLDGSLLEEMRSAYHQLEPFLDTTPTKTDTKMEDFVRLLLVSNGVDEKTIAKMGSLTPEKALEVLREAGVGRKASIAPTPPSRVGEQKLVPAADVEAWLNAGWSGKFAVGDRVMLEGVAPTGP